MRTCRRWSAEEDRALRLAARCNRRPGGMTDDLWQRGQPREFARRLEQVAMAFDRTVDAVRKRASRIGATSRR